MKSAKFMGIVSLASALSMGCTPQKGDSMEFKYEVDRFSDVQILRYEVLGFDELPAQQKEMIYYLSEAAVAGRDMLFDQNCKYNLAVRRVLEAIYTEYQGDRSAADFVSMEEYLKLVWFHNGIHHDYSSDKLTPKFSKEFFEMQLLALKPESVPTRKGQSIQSFVAEITPVIFDPTVLAKRMNQTEGEDLIVTSANNYYDGVTQAEAETFYDQLKDLKDQTPVSYGLNSRLVKENGRVFEKVWKVGGLYSEALKRVNFWLAKAEAVAETEIQKKSIRELMEYYRTGDLKMFDQYAVSWVQDTASRVDFVNGFTENYGDPLGMKASWESVVNFKNMEATKRTELISSNAQWFEDNSPVNPLFKKEKVRGVSAKVITVAMLGGDTYPSTPIGINLPNANWIRRDFGSKSVTCENITQAYDKASAGSGFGKEFCYSDTEVGLLKAYGFQTDNLHTDLHECLGHGSGKLLDGVDGDALKAYGSPLEETRADLFALYYIADPKMVELGLLPNKDAYKSEYYKYIMNGSLTQLTRIQLGKEIEQAHMRNRSTIANWILEHGAVEKIVEKVKKNDKTYIRINSYEKLRGLIGLLLAEVQRIKSEGDFEAAKRLIETYGVKVNQEEHKEILDRYAKLSIAPWRGFINPVYTAVKDSNGKITDVTIDYTEGYADQMLRYAKSYSFLPTFN